MRRNHLADLNVFLEVVEQGGFTRAAARLGTSQSAVSNSVKRLEAALGLRLLNRTTRKVSLTQAGERLADGLAVPLEEIDDQIAALSSLREEPSGLIRIAAPALAAETILWPRLSPLLVQHPDLRIELIVESRLTDIVAERFDAGVRLGESIDRDMIAVRIGPDLRMALVCSPSYLDAVSPPEHPRDLVEHNCINLRLETLGGYYVWEFEKEGRALNVRVDGRTAFNTPRLCCAAAVAGQGFTLLPEDHVQEDIASGRLVRLFEDWCSPFAGYHLYFPNRRQSSAALQSVVKTLRLR
ncbi:LysR family transcriptional regulator [Roseibium algicola]|jgi:DNA-binding transcriptional LysR family regulator|uniref:LysR family transcriptional regulator n=1 Tax=Roseibium algicola TaxID=2857014 RepID=A0ABN4WYQ5_9HYPH|nr:MULTISPECIES: LysR family transcriptional regulator [Stappiaceae]AMN51483.1 LysR family transcriptional regulator [Labrenzia sp. CP4]AQQ04538.1 LysR family transcriptional regulator [Roseibium aggregatum]NKX64383.1 LysR family transcriptional regulator [Labrenzia sp. 5N]WJS03336.1 LysR family transcriptional regulator [Roseibium aggregatum]